MLREIQDKLAKSGDPEIRESSERFFKEPVKFHGLKAADVRAIAKQHFPAIDRMDKAKVFETCEKLMQSDFHEDFMVACEFAHRVRKRFGKEDFKVFERWVAEYVNNWAKCDVFCAVALGEVLEKFPEVAGDVEKWTASENRWVRRAAAVAFIVPARRGKFLGNIFKVSDRLLEDRDDMVQKGYGWALKEASKTHPRQVYGFVVARRAKMPRTAYRYAIEKLPADMRKAAMSL
ncbi:MAG: DNA alkylation repair protein [Alphaproteobacteria bacterium]|nr:DNA alkylation repair protein [Alphaproteobacteria bacterium]